ncbi:MAG: hypothetical protein GX640_22440 [Fibrobacter sp.]|nr:hypothetical protein [Fibrobacter sp.]
MSQDNTKSSKKAFPATKRAVKSTSKEVDLIDLDVTPVMNLFMVLIPFLVSMAVFTHIAVVDFSLPPAESSENAETESKELDISIVITREGFRIVGTGNKLDMVSKINDQYLFDQLKVLLKAIKFQYPSQKSVVLILEPDIVYDDIIKFMDICRESQFPDVGLSGDIG